jgi:uncharacterized protein (DUF4415 family)
MDHYGRMNSKGYVMPKKCKPRKKPPKIRVSLWLSQSVLDFLESTGEGWQTRLDDALRLLICIAKP